MVHSEQKSIEAIEGPKILVGHSYGALLISELAGTTADVTALAYVAAFIPQAGERPVSNMHDLVTETILNAS